MYNGIINVYKEKGFTSHDVVAKLRGILKQKKIGHTGTLDPDAVGVLPVCLGSGTKLCDMITDRDKIYEAVLRLGIDTDTQDISGKVLREYGDTEAMRFKVSDEEIRKAAAGFTGAYEQLPPMYSAIKVNGRKLYEIAREGKEIERKTRQVSIYSIQIQSIEFPRVKMRVECSKGTYIRTLCKDIGDKLGIFGCMEELARIKSGPFSVEDAMKLSDIEEAVEKGNIRSYIIPVEKMFEEYRAVTVRQKFDSFLRNGNPLHPDMLKPQGEGLWKDKEQVRVYDSQEKFRAVYTYDNSKKILKAFKMFDL